MCPFLAVSPKLALHVWIQDLETGSTGAVRTKVFQRGDQEVKPQYLLNFIYQEAGCLMQIVIQ